MPESDKHKEPGKLDPNDKRVCVCVRAQLESKM